MVISQELEAEIFKVLSRPYWNAWWSTGKVGFAVQPFERSDLKYITKRLEDTLVMVVGARQTGKTTMVSQIIKGKLAEGVEPKRLLYAELDEESLQLACKPECLLMDVIETYQKRVLKEDLWSVQSPTYLFLDEVQSVPNWASVLKSLKPTANVKVLATGSASVRITQAGRETLPGRKAVYKVFPLKFADACRLSNKWADGDNHRKIEEWRYKLREALVNSINGRNPKLLLEALGDCKIAFTPTLLQMAAAAEDYLLIGGYPKPVTTPDRQEAQRLLDDYAEDVIMKDLMPWFGVRDHANAKKLLYLLASANGQELNVNTLLQRLQGSNRITLEKYVNAFEETALVTLVDNWSKSKMGSTKHPKVYFNDCGLRNAILGQYGAPASDAELGVLAETAVHDHLRRLAFKVNGSQECGVLFNRGAQGNETDFVMKLSQQQETLPIEVKFRRQAGKRSAAGIRRFVNEEKTPGFGLTITQDEIIADDQQAGIPLWMFLMLC
ncbi:MAG: ATP-binding protein [Candidatus Micrarchaeota archaeon]